MLQLFEGGGHDFFFVTKIGVLGAFFFIEVRQQHHLLCTDQCPKVVQKVSILLSTFLMSLFQILLRAHAQEKKPKWYTFSGCSPSSFS